MNTGSRRARVRALAKLNLDLRVLNRRADGYHEIRTIFQTISLADTIDLEFTPARRTTLRLDSSIDIPDNLARRAAAMAMDTLRFTGEVNLRLTKRIPMGAGLGGGSSDAAAVLLALPVLAGRAASLESLLRMASELGSDVPFFLLGGAAVGLGRGTEVYPLPDLPAAAGIVAAPPIHVSTAEAYRELSRKLTSQAQHNMINSFQSCAWRATPGVSPESWRAAAANDFERVVLARHPRLKSFKKQLLGLGANHVMMTGSGCALFGLFGSRRERDRALLSLRGEKVFPMEFVSRARFRALWRRRLSPFVEGKVWPPQVRSANRNSTA